MTIAEMTLSPAAFLGHEDIDRQHLALVGLYNRGLAFWRRHGRLEEGYLDDLKRLALDHFLTEETYMRGLGYPGLAEQRGEHERLLSTLRHMGGEGASALEIVTFLGNWIEYHTVHVDARFVEFVREGNRK